VRIAPREALDGTPPIYALPPRRIYWVGLLLLAATYFFSRLSSGQGVPLLGYLASFTLFLGFILTTPLFLIVMGRLLSLFLSERRTPEATLALSHLLATPSRTAGTVSALMVSLAMLVGVVIIIHSFRSTVELWIDQTVTADLIGAPSSSFLNGTRPVFPQRVLTDIAGTEGVGAVDGYRSLRLRYGGEQVILAGRDLETHRRYSRFLFQSGAGNDPILLARKRAGALISEAMANRFGLKVGDFLALPSPAGIVRLPVTGVFYDYSTEGGKVIVDRTLLSAFWREGGANVAAIYLRPGTDREKVRRRLVEAFGEKDDMVFLTHGRFKEEVLAIFDQTFMITYALEGVAVLVALLGIVNSLLTSILERRREMGMIRAIGAQPRQILKMVLYEAGLIGTAGYFLGLLCGLLLSLILIFVINKQSFGWTILFFFPFRIIPEGMVLVLLTSLAASVLPARRLLRLSIGEAIAYE